MTSQQHAQKQSLKGRLQTPDQALQKRFGQRIQELRLKHGFSQEEISKKVVPPSAETAICIAC